MDAVAGFRIERVLGSGSLGVVYQAQDLRTDREVALKILRSGETEHRTSFRREVRLLEKIGHPGIARVLQHDENAERPWCALEYIEGQPLERMLAGGSRASATTEALAPFLRVAFELCRPLAAVHGEGIVHRDLKPANVIVTSHRGPVLVDFDLASRFSALTGRERLESGGAMAGTVAYMSPEQIRGDDVDARTDLYALGCILYEIAAGRPPFAGSPGRIAQQHLDGKPPPLRSGAPALPAALEELVASLLEKDPRNRPGYADEVATALHAWVADAGPVAAGQDSRPYLYRPRFVGHRDAVAVLDEAVAAARQGRGSLTLLVGESGVGKTRLAMQALRRAGELGMDGIAAECIAPESDRDGAQGGPLHPVRPVLQRIADAPRETAELVLGDCAGTLVPFESALLSFVGEGTDLSSRRTQDRVIADLAQTLQRFVRQRPVVLAIDDIQWADPLTLDFLAALPPSYFDEGLALVLTCRSEEWTPSVAELAARPHARRVDVGRLDESEVHSIVADMLGLRTPPLELARFVCESSEGNPFFAAQHLHGAIDAGLLERRDGRWHAKTAGANLESRLYEQLPLPRSLRELVDRRLERLSADAIRLIEVAAVTGREFDARAAAELAGLEPRAGDDAVEELLAQHLVADIRSGMLRFEHDKVREAAYSRIDTARRPDMHRRVAERMEEVATGTERGPLLPILGHHWAVAGQRERAREYLDTAGDHMLRSGAFRDAARVLYRAGELDTEGRSADAGLRRARRERQLGQAAAGVGDIQASVRHSERALEQIGLRTPRSLVRWLAALGLESARCALPAGRRRAPDPVVDEAARACQQAATGYYFAFDLLPALVASLQCVNLSARTSSPGLGALAASQLGSVFGAVRAHSLARRFFARAEREAAEGDDAFLNGAGLYFLAIYETGLGRWQNSVDAGERSIRALRALGDEQEAEIAATVVANALHLAGRHAEALRWSRELTDSASRRWNAQHSGWGSFLSGRAYLALGHVEEAQRWIERGYEYLSRVPDTVSTMMCEGLLADTLLRRGEEARAVELCERLTARVRSTGGWSPLVPLVQCIDGYACRANVYLSLAERGSRVLPEREMKDAIRSSCRELRLFGRMFPSTRPKADRLSAREAALRGDLRAASRLLQDGLRHARRLDVGYEVALCHWTASRMADGHERARLREEAASVLRRLGMDAQRVLAAEDRLVAG